MKVDQQQDQERRPSYAQALQSVPRNVWSVTLTSFLTDVSSEMLFSLLPLFMANVLGLRTGLIGLVEGIAVTTSSLLKAYSGWLSDRLGKRKNLALFGYGLSTAAKPFLLLANSWVSVLAVRLTDRIGKGIRTAPRDALIADSVAESRRGLAFGLHRAGDTAGAAVGLSIALVVVWLTQGARLALERETFQLLIIVATVPAVLAVLVIAIGVKESAVEPTRSKLVPKPSGKLGTTYRRYLIITLIFALGNSADVFIILRAQERGLTVISILGMLIAFNLVYALTSGPAGAVADRLGKRTLIVTGWLTYAAIYLGFAFLGQRWQIWILLAAYGLYYGMTEGVGRAMVADLVKPEVHGAAYGLYSSIIGLAALPASLIAGILWQGVGPWTGLGPSAPFIFGGSLALVAAVLLTRLDVSLQTAV